jgi:hypothetical protein
MRYKQHLLYVEEVTTFVICCKHHPSNTDKSVLKNTSSILNVIMPYVPVSYAIMLYILDIHQQIQLIIIIKK